MQTKCTKCYDKGKPGGCPKCGKEIYKSEVQFNSQYYKDLHQIAGDLRFI